MRLLARAFALTLSLALQVHAAAPQEYQVKAVFLFNFTEFIGWPSDAFADASTPMSICILGDDPFGSYLDDAVRNENVDQHVLIVRRLRYAEPTESCQMLFISRSEAAHVDEIIRRTRGSRTLTVGDSAAFGEHGGMVGFVTQDNRIRLRINVEAIKAAGLTISSKLLRIAEIVGDERSMR